MSARRKVLLAMSGGVDSSVAACLLVEQGYDVVGVFMRLGTQFHPESGSCRSGAEETGTRGAHDLPVHDATTPHPPDEHRQGCCSTADATDARLVAGKLGIPFYVLNFERTFSKLIDYFADEYAAGRTPNPCIMCNRWLKFGRLVEYADVVGADLIATGHYARRSLTNGRPRLLRARDRAKDQSYVLFGIEPDVLRRTLFPLGELTKRDVRCQARRWGLSLHNKPESQDICFVPDGDYARVVRARRPDAFRAGRICHTDGRVLGTHEGVPGFTIGQRRGLRVAVGSPVYVAELDPSTATVTVGPQEAVWTKVAFGSRVQWLCDVPDSPFRADVRIRYNHVASPAEVTPLPDDKVRVRFDKPQWAVTPGQALVMYRGDEVLGGGWIETDDPAPCVATR